MINQAPKVKTSGQRSARTFQDLKVWSKAHQYVLALYEFTKTLPKEEIYGLVSQMRRAAVSIPANIAEGFRKRSDKDKIRYYNIAQGSLEESRYYLILVRDLDYGRGNQLSPMLEEVSKLLEAYIAAILNSES